MMPEYIIMPFSAHSEKALYDNIRSFIVHIKRTNVALRDIAYSYQVGKVHHEYRAAFVAHDFSDLLDQCSLFLDKNLYEKKPIISSPRIAFLFTGQGSQYIGMGQKLYEESLVFKEAIDSCALILDKLLPKKLVEILFDSNTKLINDTNITQPVLFAVEYALAQQWIALGFKPSLVLGHSLGEWVAACIANAFSLEDACKLVFHRGSLMKNHCEPGSMAIVSSSALDIEPVLKKHNVVISAYNGVRNVVIGGEHEKIKACVKDLESQGIRTKELMVSHAFHTPLVLPMVQKFQDLLEKVPISALNTRFISSLDGTQKTGFEPDYWSRQISEPTLFDQCLKTLDQSDANIIIEIGPKPTLSKLANLSLSKSQLIIYSLKENTHDYLSLYQNISEIWCAGVDLNWQDFYQAIPRRVHTPPYAYQRKEYCLSSNPLPKEETVKAQIFDLPEIILRLKAIWHDLLGVKDLDNDSNFMMLGADSLSSAKLLARTKQVFGVSITLAEMYQQQALGPIATLIHAKIKKASNNNEDVQSMIRSAHIIGAETFLGAHVLKELFDSTKAAISYEQHPQADNALAFYFGDNFLKLLKQRESSSTENADIIFDLSAVSTASSIKGGITKTYQVGPLVGHYQTGMMAQTPDLFYLHLKNLNTYGYFPASSSPLNLLPVDFAASALVELAQAETTETVFQIFNPYPVESREIYDAMQFLDCLIDAKSDVLPMFSDLALPCDHTWRLAEKAGVHCPKIDTTFLLRMINYCIQIGFLCKVQSPINFSTPLSCSTDMSAPI